MEGYQLFYQFNHFVFHVIYYYVLIYVVSFSQRVPEASVADKELSEKLKAEGIYYQIYCTVRVLWKLITGLLSNVM